MQLKLLKKINKKKRIESSKGFTLIEVMVALAIVATGLTSLFGMQISAIKHNVAGNRVGQAATLVQDKLEHLRWAENNYISNGYNGDSSCGTGWCSDTTSDYAGTTFKREWKFTPSTGAACGGAGACQPINVDVKVSWPVGSNTRTVQMSNKIGGY